MKKKFGIIPVCLIVLSIFLYQPTSASACSCEMPPPVEKEFSRSHAVFRGEVIGVKENRWPFGGSGKSVYFEVKETWKGISETEVVITTGIGGGDCGIPFTTGQEYIVYANLSDMYGNKSLTSIICGRTAEVGNAAEDIKSLGQGEIMTKEMDSVEGKWGTTSSFIVGVIFVAGLLAIFCWNKFKKV